MGELIANIDRFPRVYAEGTAVIETKLRPFLPLVSSAARAQYKVEWPD